ncbi:hypothetical protein [Effusibacillus consociatus]|uniref:Uncharacterized protein n=1 Tax=Effusibacillus consociatus TaxID=1117041 RepID=A0ABV9Q1E6_9BACL
MERIRKVALSFAVSALALSSANSAFAASSEVSVDENLNRPKLEKPAIPADPRGPLPKDPSEWDEWIKKHPDPLAKEQKKTDKKTDTVQSTAYQFGPLVNGDIILGANAVDPSKYNSIPYGYYRHNAMYDSSQGNFISATSSTGVYRESQNFWSIGYNVLKNLYVTSADYYTRQRVVANAATNMGEPYDWNSAKYDSSKWYCSKLPWFGYYYVGGIEIDSNWGYWVTPDGYLSRW